MHYKAQWLKMWIIFGSSSSLTHTNEVTLHTSSSLRLHCGKLLIGWTVFSGDQGYDNTCRETMVACIWKKEEEKKLIAITVFSWSLILLTPALCWVVVCMDILTFSQCWTLRFPGMGWIIAFHRGNISRGKITRQGCVWFGLTQQWRHADAKIIENDKR